MRVPDTLIKQCRDALIKADLADRNVSDGDAIRMLAELGANVVSNKLLVMDDETRDQFVRETEEKAIRFGTHRTVEAVCKLLGVDGSYNPETNEWLLKTTHPIQPGEVVFHDTPQPQPSVMH